MLNILKEIFNTNNRDGKINSILIRDIVARLNSADERVCILDKMVFRLYKKYNQPMASETIKKSKKKDTERELTAIFKFYNRLGEKAHYRSALGRSEAFTLLINRLYEITNGRNRNIVETWLGINKNPELTITAKITLAKIGRMYNISGGRVSIILSKVFEALTDKNRQLISSN